MNDPGKRRLHRIMWQRGCRDCRYFIHSLEQCSRGIGNCILVTEDLSKDRPACELCYWWNEQRDACCLGPDNCAYLVWKKTDQKAREENGLDCSDCPYKTSRPCVGVCMRNVLREWRKIRTAVQKAGDDLS